jgi:16S rRNA processing protein RimM
VDGERELGRVERLMPLPSCEALEVFPSDAARGAGGGVESFLVPLVRDAVRRVDVVAKVIDVDVAFLGDTVPESMRSDAAAARSVARASGPAER